MSDIFVRDFSLWASTYCWEVQPVVDLNKDTNELEDESNNLFVANKSADTSKDNDEDSEDNDEDEDNLDYI